MTDERNDAAICAERTLLEWLTAVNAVALWEAGDSPPFPLPRAIIRVTMYRVGAATAIVTRYTGGGWDIYTPSESSSIAVTLRDAETRTGSVFKLHDEELAAKDAALTAELEAIVASGDDT